MNRPEAPLLTIRYIAAFQLAFEAHTHQLRKGTSVPHLEHPMVVSALVLEAGGDEDCAIAALLHDAVEDSDNGAVVLERSRGQFGPRVASIVVACSDSSATPGEAKPPWRERKEQSIAHLQAADADARLVSACDKLHNPTAIVAGMREMGSGFSTVLTRALQTRSGTTRRSALFSLLAFGPRSPGNFGASSSK